MARRPEGTGRDGGLRPLTGRRRRWFRQRDPRSEGRYVLYRMQMARRGRDNLALEEAIRRADSLGLPVVVYEGLSHRDPGASRRIHRFVLEAAWDTAQDLAQRGIPYVFVLRRGADDQGDALGTTRPMTTRSTRRKFDLGPYFRRVDRWERAARRSAGAAA